MRTIKLFGALFLLSCSSPPDLGSQVVVSDELSQDTLIVLQRGACERRCAVYNLILFSDGSAIFDGRHYVGKPGLTKTTVSREAVGKLLDEAAALKFFDLPEKYVPGSPGCNAAPSDAPTAVLTISARGRTKTVLHHLACKTGDAGKLAALEEKIDKTLNTVRWVK
ncbi:MAG: DUF6438 domain-containing protein [Acidobacteriota bacterium]